MGRGAAALGHLQHFFCEGSVVGRSIGTGLVAEDVLPERGTFGELDVAADAGVEDLGARPGQVLAGGIIDEANEVVDDLGRELGVGVEQVSTIPVTRRCGFIRRFTSCTVCSSLPTPCNARKCGCMGMMTSVATDRALMVSRPSDGGQSSSTKS